MGFVVDGSIMGKASGGVAFHCTPDVLEAMPVLALWDDLADNDIASRPRCSSSGSGREGSTQRRSPEVRPRIFRGGLGHGKPADNRFFSIHHVNGTVTLP